MNRKNKIILMDFGFYVHASGWASQHEGAMPVNYICLNMMISDLKKIGLEPEDTVIVGIDYHGEDYSSWRKQFSTEYKVGRTPLPIETYQKLNEVIDIMALATDWNPILLPHLEYDDIAAVACRYYKEKDVEVVIISADCLSGETRIKMSDGTNKELRRIKPGDKVVSYNFKNKRFDIGNVSYIHKRKHKIEYEIFYEQTKKPIKSSENHKFLTTKGWKKACNLLVGDELMYHKKSILPKIKYQDSYKIGYIMGLAQGDGYFDYDRRSIKIELKDKEPLERLKIYVKDLFDYDFNIRPSKQGKYWVCSLYLNVWFEYLFRFWNKQKVSDEFKKGTLAGFYDAEGSLAEDYSSLRLQLDSTNINLLKRIQKYVKDLNLKTSKIFPSNKNRENEVFRFSLNAENVVQFLNLCKPSLLRKYPKWEHHVNHLHNGLKITKIKKKQSPKHYTHYDLTVGKFSNYIVNNTVLVHNCDLEQMWIYDHVKVFSPHGKSKRYKIKPENWDIYKVLAKKISKEAKDQVTSEVTNEKDYKHRELIMDLTKLPEWIEDMVFKALDEMTYHKEDMSLMPYPYLRDRYDSIFNDHSKVVTYDQSIKMVEKQNLKKKKKAKEAREKKKLVLSK